MPACFSFCLLSRAQPRAHGFMEYSLCPAGRTLPNQYLCRQHGTCCTPGPAALLALHRQPLPQALGLSGGTGTGTGTGWGRMGYGWLLVKLPWRLLCTVLLCCDLKKCQCKQQEQYQAVAIAMEIWGILASLDVLQPVLSCCPSNHKSWTADVRGAILACSLSVYGQICL